MTPRGPYCRPPSSASWAPGRDAASSTAETTGRILLLTLAGAAAAPISIQAIAEGERWGYPVLPVAALLSYGLLRHLRRWAHRPRETPDDRWTRTDGAVTTLVAMSAVVALARTVVTDDTAGERLSHLVVAPLWLALAAYFVVARRHHLRDH